MEVSCSSQLYPITVIKIFYCSDVTAQSQHSNSSLKTLRYSAAEVLAAATLELFPYTQLVKGEVFEWGFYYDFVFSQPVNQQHVSLIEERMRAIVKERRPVTSVEMLRDNARNYFLDHNQAIKAEILEAVNDTVVELFRMGDFLDVCPQPYITETKQIEAFRLHKCSPKNIALPSRELTVIRIVGSVFGDKASLKKNIKIVELAKKRDHRKLGKELQLFGIQESIGAGLWCWYPKGALVRKLLIEWWESEQKHQRCFHVCSPDYMKRSFLDEAGFFDIDPEHKGNKLFPSFSLEDGEYCIVPHRAASHAIIFRSLLHSYRELPLRYAECGNTYAYQRDEQSRGMCKARSICVDEGTIFCTEDQLRDEVVSSLQFIMKMIKIFGFEYKCYLTVRGRRYAGTIGQWKTVERVFADSMSVCGCLFQIDDHDSTFFGPAVRVRIKDSIDREWDGPSVMVDFHHPQRLGLRYQGPDGDMHTPMMIRRSIFGSLERFIALLVEQYAGIFPLWLTPEQVRILPVTENNEGFAEVVRNELEAYDLRVGTDYRQVKLAARMRTAQCDKVPYAVVLGDEEEKSGMVAVRLWNSADTWRVKVDAFREKMLEEVATKKIFVRDPGE